MGKCSLVIYNLVPSRIISEVFGAPKHSFIYNNWYKNRERALLVLHISYAGTWVHATNQKCQLKSDRFNYKRDSVGIISVTRVSRLHKTRFTKKLWI